MNCHLCKQPITPGEPTKPVGRQGRTILEAHIDCAAIESDFPEQQPKPKTFKSFAEAVQYIDKHKYPQP